MLLVAGAHYKHQGARENAITNLFDVRPTVFHQRINQLLDLEPAFAWNPQLINRPRAQLGSRVHRASWLGVLMPSIPAAMRSWCRGNPENLEVLLDNLTQGQRYEIALQRRKLDPALCTCLKGILVRASSVGEVVEPDVARVDALLANYLRELLARADPFAARRPSCSFRIRLRSTQPTFS